MLKYPKLNIYSLLPNIHSRPGVSTRAQSALGGVEDRGKPSALDNPPKKNPKIPRMDPAKEARADIQAPRHTEEQGNVDMRSGGDHVDNHKRPRQNSPHQ
ncbi:hypothetical protein LIER_28997 [Lithospermum erythrorhizon]|uniref:Uncharacterized protein n=1 Tax=Lithospermum erythrorhizon TaxID=34254 RepID=A0AAV3RJ85_LITER